MFLVVQINRHPHYLVSFSWWLWYLWRYWLNITHTFSISTTNCDDRTNSILRIHYIIIYQCFTLSICWLYGISRNALFKIWWWLFFFSECRNEELHNKHVGHSVHHTCSFCCHVRVARQTIWDLVNILYYPLLSFHHLKCCELLKTHLASKTCIC